MWFVEYGSGWCNSYSVSWAFLRRLYRHTCQGCHILETCCGETIPVLSKPETLPAIHRWKRKRPCCCRYHVPVYVSFAEQLQLLTMLRESVVRGQWENSFLGCAFALQECTTAAARLHAAAPCTYDINYQNREEKPGSITRHSRSGNNNEYQRWSFWFWEISRRWLWDADEPSRINSSMTAWPPNATSSEVEFGMASPTTEICFKRRQGWEQLFYYFVLKKSIVMDSTKSNRSPIFGGWSCRRCKESGGQNCMLGEAPFQCYLGIDMTRIYFVRRIILVVRILHLEFCHHGVKMWTMVYFGWSSHSQIYIFVHPILMMDFCFLLQSSYALKFGRGLNIEGLNMGKSTCNDLHQFS